MRIPIASALALVLIVGGRASAGEAHDASHTTVAHTPRPDAHAPIGVMGDHLHHAGEWMLSYRYMFMRMDENLDGTSQQSNGQILLPSGQFMVSPTDMNMQMHMFGVMYAPLDRITLMGTLPYLVLDMDHETAAGTHFTTRSQGIGDVSVTALVGLWKDEHHEVHLDAGVSFPSGSIDRKDDTPASMGRDVILPYPMQLGSGTVDLLPGLTYNGRSERLSWGAQARGTVRLGRNDEGYRLGDRYALTGWGAVVAADWVSVGGRVGFEQWWNIDGQDDRIPGVTNAMGQLVPAEQVVPTADPDRRAGKRLELGPSINLITTGGLARGLRLGIEALFPVWQDLDGPQLGSRWSLMAGLQYAF